MTARKKSDFSGLTQIRTKLPPSDRIKLIERVVKDGASISQACNAFNVSRPTYYQWLRKYDPKANYEQNLENLSDKRKTLGKPKNRISSHLEEKVRGIVLSSDPNFSKYRLYKRFLRKFPDAYLGLHGFYNSLVRLHLNTPNLRRRHIRAKRKSERAWADSLPATERQKAVERILRGIKVGQVAEELSVSRATLHRWLRDYNKAEEGGRREALRRRKSVRERWPGQATPNQRQVVLELVATHPTASKYELANLLQERYGDAALGVHGVYNVLRRDDLSTPDRRVAWARLLRQSADSVQPAIRPELGWVGRVKQVFQQFLPTLAPAPPPGVLSGLFSGIQRFSTFILLSTFILFLLFSWGTLLGSAGSTSQAVGFVFASLALSMGSLFFLYSLKYYFTLAVVLSFSRESDPTSEHSTSEVKPASPAGREVSTSEVSVLQRWLGRLFGMTVSSARRGLAESRPRLSGSGGGGDLEPRQTGLEPDISKIELERRPFISVHLPMYNEKRVAERILKACTGFDYPSTGSGQANFEIIVADDSTDETTEIVRRFAERWNNSTPEYSTPGASAVSSAESVKEVPTPGVSIKVIHRETREGFKGGALKEALKHTDPRAEFIVVFDADFVPYPDTLELFVKYFSASAEATADRQVNAGSLDANVYANNNTANASESPSTGSGQPIRSDSHDTNSDSHAFVDSRIAAVQGYQWPSAQSASPPVQAGKPFDEAQGKHVYAYQDSSVAAVQGYQWHVLNKSENWITRGVRSEYAGSYVIERSGAELYGGLKQIAGSVYMIRRDLLDRFGWETSITEDFQLTLKLYEAGYKVVYTPYIQAPAECASTLKRLIRQRMRWAEGHSFNIRKMFTRLLLGGWSESDGEAAPMVKWSHGQMVNHSTIQPFNNASSEEQGKVWKPSPLTLSEKLEFLYLSPYYLQAAFFLIGTIGWLISETVFKAQLPFWTAVWGWSLVLTNLLSLPLMNTVGLFLEEAEERDFAGILSFVALSYILVPFQAYAAVKGFVESEEGPWFRTPKTGRITDILTRGRFYRFVRGILQDRKPRIVGNIGFSLAVQPLVALAASSNILRRRKRWVGNAAVSLTLTVAILVNRTAVQVELVSAQLQEPSFNAVSGAVAQEVQEVTDGLHPLDTPVIYTYETSVGMTEQIFHPEPRVRIKSAGRELELVTVGSVGLGTPSHNGASSQGHQVTYEGIFGGVDLRYTSNAGRLVEEFILEEYQELQAIESLVRMVDLAPRQAGGTIEFADERTGESVFILPPPFLYEQPEGVESHPLRFEQLSTSGVEYSLGIEYEMHRTPLGWKLSKRLTESGKQWLADPGRRFPVVIDPSVIVSGGITDSEVQFGSLQRKVAFMPNATVGAAWYAFYQSGGDILYKRCLASSNCDQTTDWSAAQDILTADADNYNPTIWVKGDVIWAAWIDDGAEAIEFNSIDTASSDSTGTQCASANLGTIDSSNMVSIAVQETGSNIYVAQSDTSTDTEVHLFEVTTACSFTDRTSGSGLTAGDRPVLVYDGDSGKRDDVLVVFQDGNLSYSIWSSTTSIWSGSNVTLASVTDSTYAVVSDGASAWVVTQSGTTSTNFYRIGAIESVIDTNVGGNRASMDIDCPASGDCKLVYSDTAAATTDITFVDCNNTACSAPVTRSLDSNVGRGSHYGVPVAIDCVSATDCKIVYYSLSADDIFFIDCNDADCGTRTSQILDTSTGREMPSYVDIYCVSSTDCKVTYVESDLNDLKFVDCADTDCNPLTAGYSNIAIDTEVGELGGISTVYCPASDDCKIVYYDSSTTNGSIFFTDCADSPCTLASNTYTEVDTNVGIGDTRFSAVDCTAGASECRFVYYDGTDQDVTFVDCNASATCSGSTSTDIDTDVGAVGSPVSMECNNNAGSPDDCKIFYYDGTDQDVTFVDCNNDTCSSSATTDIDSAVGADSAYLALDCISVSDCQLLYLDGAEMDITLVDCEDGDCSNPTSFTDIDTTVESEQPWVSIDCPSASNCKIVYHDISEGDITFADCNDAACSSPTLTDIDTDVGRMGAPSSINCPASNDCKVVYFSYIAQASKFADCNDEACSAPTINTLDTTVEDNTSRSAIDCPTAADCKIVYHDTPGSDIKFVDCNDEACSARSTEILDTAVETYPSGVDIDCSLGATDCRVVFFDGADDDITYVDCGGGSPTDCSTNTQTDVDVDVGTRSVDLSAQIDCAGGTDDCKIFYHDNIDGDVTFIDCSVAATCCVNAGCTGVGETATVTDIDAAVGGDNNRFVLNLAMDCVSASNCKLVYYDKTDATYYFVDCDSGDCSSNTSRPLTTTPGTAGGPIAMDCGSDDTDCKIVYSDTNETSVKFIDCLGATCMENSLTAPWTSETNVLGVSLTLDSTNDRLYAHVIKDSVEKAYFKDTDKDSISWGDQFSYGFTAGDLNHISSPLSEAGPTQIGVVLRQNSNYEFSAVPETWQTILVSGLIAIGWLKRRELRSRFKSIITFQK